MEDGYLRDLLQIGTPQRTQGGVFSTPPWVLRLLNVGRASLLERVCSSPHWSASLARGTTFKHHPLLKQMRAAFL